MKMKELKEAVASLEQLTLPPMLEPTVDRVVDFSDPNHPAHKAIESANNMILVYAQRISEEAYDCVLEFDKLDHQIREALGVSLEEAVQYDQIKGKAFVWETSKQSPEVAELAKQMVYGRVKIKLLYVAQLMTQKKLAEQAEKLHVLLEQHYAPAENIAVIGEHVVELKNMPGGVKA